MTGPDAFVEPPWNRTFIQSLSSWECGNEACAGVSLRQHLRLQDAVIPPRRKVKSPQYHCNRLLQQEVILARMEQIPLLFSRALTDDERAQLLYERGVLYDSLGLRA